MAVPTYDPRQVIITFGGNIITGFAQDSFLDITPANQAFTKYTGADGGTSRGKSNDYSSVVTITLSQTSPSNAVLSAIAEADRLLNAGKLPLQIVDVNGTTLKFWAQAWIQQNPDEGFATEVGDRAWTLDTGQPAQNIVGGALI